MYLIENSQGNSAEQTPSNSPLSYNESFTQLLTPGLSIVTIKFTCYMETKYLQNLNMQYFILCLYTNLFRGLKFRT